MGNLTSNGRRYLRRCLHGLRRRPQSLEPTIRRLRGALLVVLQYIYVSEFEHCNYNIKKLALIGYLLHQTRVRGCCQ